VIALNIECKFVTVCDNFESLNGLITVSVCVVSEEACSPG